MSFNGVTNIPNMVAFNFLKPWSWTSNWGNELQFNYQDINIPPQIAYMAQNAMNPSFWANYNVATTSQPIYMYNQNDAMTQASINNAYQQGYELGEKLKIQGSVQNAYSSLNSLKQSVNSLLQREDLPSDKKQQLEEIKKQIDKLEKKLQEVANKSQVQNSTQTKEELEAILGELLELTNKTTEIAKSLPPEATAATEPTAPTSATEPTSATSATSPTAATSATSATEPTDPTDPTLSDNAEQKYMLNQVCVMLDKAIDGPGTDYDGEQGMKTVLEAFVKPDNVIELWNQWDNTYGQQGAYKADEDGFIETLMDECEFGQKEEIATILINAMELRALQKGINIDSELAAARKAAKSNWLGWSNSDEIQTTLKAIYEKLK